MMNVLETIPKLANENVCHYIVYQIKEELLFISGLGKK